MNLACVPPGAPVAPRRCPPAGAAVPLSRTNTLSKSPYKVEGVRPRALRRTPSTEVRACFVSPPLSRSSPALRRSAPLLASGAPHSSATRPSFVEIQPFASGSNRFQSNPTVFLKRLDGSFAREPSTGAKNAEHLVQPFNRSSVALYGPPGQSATRPVALQRARSARLRRIDAPPAPPRIVPDTGPAGV